MVLKGKRAGLGDAGGYQAFRVVVFCYPMLHLFWYAYAPQVCLYPTVQRWGLVVCSEEGQMEGQMRSERAHLSCPSLAAASGSKHRERDLPQDTRGNISTTSNSDHEVRRELGEDLLGRLLAQLVDLW